ncbi:hypothetical protein KSS87_004406 [Heliosperma pusillum]|nr:hypothetical protein KSS87_004406 [Heliosperma pusillum]
MMEKFKVSKIKLISGKPNFSQKKGLMGERVFKIQALESGDSEENIRVLEQENLVDGSSSFQSFNLSSDFESTLNRLPAIECGCQYQSKWLVAAIFGAVILWRHDPEAVWAVMGSVLNSVLSVVLKRVLNQERPVSNRRSDPGMPSSHAQSIFFAAVFVIMSTVLLYCGRLLRCVPQGNIYPGEEVPIFICFLVSPSLIPPTSVVISPATM